MKRNALAPDELIRAVRVPVTGGPQQFAKIGTRNAMVIAVGSFALALDPGARRVGTGIGSAAPTPRARTGRPRTLAGRRARLGRPAPLDAPVVRRFGELVAAAAAPIDDVRGTAAYRRHALAVLAAPHRDLGLGRVPHGGGVMRVSCTVNGEQRGADDVWAGESLLYVLRERLGLPGSKNACEQGECGSCTVYLDGVPVCACLVAAGQAEGREWSPSRGWPTASASTRCSRPSSTPARCSADSARRAWSSPCTTCSQRDPDPADADIREALAGNLCRCTGYEKILDAVRLAASRTGGAR